MADVFPSGLFNVSEVDVRIIRGNYIPCKSCHWYNVCTVPKAQHFQKMSSSYGTFNVIYQCLEYTTKK